MEWNNVGISERAMEALSMAVISNKGLISLDLRNNKIEGTSAIYIYDIIQKSSLQLLDLRWNDLGPNSSKGILSSLQQNTILTRLELTGNRISEDVMACVDEIINKNLGKDKIPGQNNDKEVIKVMFSPSKTSPNIGPPKGLEGVIDEKIKMGEYRTMYDDEFARKEKTERKLGDAEHELNKERERNAEARDELIKTVEQQKKVRKFKIIIESKRSKG